MPAKLVGQLMREFNLFWITGNLVTGFPIKDARLLKYLKSIFLIILTYLSSMRSKIMFFLILRNGRLFWEILYLADEGANLF